MKDLLEKILQNVDYDDPGWDDEFYVSISKAAEFSGLSESQIRYFESLSGINIGQREGPKERNRVYTRQDVKLLRAVYLCADARPAEIAQVIKEHQKLILERLGRVTLPTIIQREEYLGGENYLFAGLVAILLSLWQEIADPQESLIQGVILGPQKASWKASILQDLKSNSFIDLADSLVIWSAHPGKASATDCKIFFSQRSWYLPFANNLAWNTYWFDEMSASFAVIILWQCPHSEGGLENPQRLPTLKLDEPALLLTNMLMQSLKRGLERHSGSFGEPISVYSRGSLGPVEVLHGLSLLLESCIRPYFPDCYAYVADFKEDGSLCILNECGNPENGYTPQLLHGFHSLDMRRMPWWITFAKEKASIALDLDSTRRPERRDERGSVVCIPLIGQERVVGVLGVENTSATDEGDCLKTRDGITSHALLRYLICMTEIAAGYLNHRISSFERFERSRLAYTRHETIDWYWNIYQQGGLNYSQIIENILAWNRQLEVVAEKRTNTVNIMVLDIANEDTLAKEYKGFDIVISLLQATQARIKEVIHNDFAAYEYASKKQLFLFEKPVADHIVLAAADIPKEYLLIFLERIQRIWLRANDRFVWEGKEIDVSVQVGFCSFSNLGWYEPGIATELLKHHLWMLSNQLLENTSLEHILEYDAVVPTVSSEKL